MGHYTGQVLAVTFGGVPLPGIREVSIPEEHPAPDTTHAPDAHGQGIQGGIIYHNGCTMLFVDQSGETSWDALPGGTVGTLAIYPEGIADGKRKITMRIVITNRDRLMSYDNAVVFTVTFNATLYRAGISGEMKALYVATTAGGIFMTDNFTAADDPAQPIWTAVNGGLGVLTIHNFDLDPFDPYGRQLCLTKTEETAYIRYGAGNWVPLITRAQVRAATNASAVVRWVTADKAVGGRVWVYAVVPNLTEQGFAYCGFTDNDGAVWTWRTNLDTTSVMRAGGNLVAAGDILWRASNDGLGGLGRVSYSANNGATWIKSASLGSSVWTPFVYVNPFGTVYVPGNGIGGPDLVQVDTALTLTVLQNALDLGGPATTTRDSQMMWFSANSAGYQRILKDGKIYATLDGWATVVTATPPYLRQYWNFDSLVAPMTGNEDAIICGPRAAAVAQGQTHLIYAVDGDTGTPVGKAGADVGGGVDSIPTAANGLALNGIGAVIF